MTKPARPATVRFYVDADVLGLAKEFVRIRGDVTYPAIRARPPPAAVLDHQDGYA